MDKKSQRATLLNVHNALKELCVQGKDAKVFASVLEALATVHDAIARECQELSSGSESEVKE